MRHIITQIWFATSAPQSHILKTTQVPVVLVGYLTSMFYQLQGNWAQRQAHQAGGLPPVRVGGLGVMLGQGCRRGA